MIKILFITLTIMFSGVKESSPQYNSYNQYVDNYIKTDEGKVTKNLAIDSEDSNNQDSILKEQIINVRNIEIGVLIYTIILLFICTILFVIAVENLNRA